MTTEALPRYTLKDVDDLLTDVRAQPTKRDAVDHLCEHYPHIRESWIRDRWAYLSQMDTAQLVQVLGFPDPVGERAVDRVISERGY